MSTFEQAVKAIIQKTTNATLLIGIVAEVREDDFDVTIPQHADFKKVRLKSILNSGQSSFKTYPKPGSVVVIGILENDPTQAVLIAVSEIDKFEIKHNGAELIVAEGKIRIQNAAGNLQDELVEMATKIKEAIILTPAGPGTMRPEDQAYIQQRIETINQILF